MVRFAEDSFDDIEEEAYQDYEEDYSDLGISIKFDDEDYYAPEAKAEIDTTKNDDWDINGLNKTYDDSKFNLEKAEALFYSFDAEGSDFDIESQKESIRYANYYAKNRDLDAQNFIISIVQKRDEIDPVIAEIATNSFALFIRNYIRKIVEKHYNGLPIPISEKSEYIRDGINECFADILGTIQNYDPVKANKHITSYYSSAVLQGSILTFEAHRRGRSSKQTSRPDTKVANAMKKLQEQGEAPTVQKISILTGMKCDSIRNSKARIIAENTMGTLDSPEVANLSSDVFGSPESIAIQKEKHNQLFSKLDCLDPDEKAAFLAIEGFELVNGELLELESDLSDAKLGKLLGMAPERIRYLHNIALRKLKAEYGFKPKNDTDLLRGRNLTFTNEEPEEFDFLDGVVRVIL